MLSHGLRGGQTQGGPASSLTLVSGKMQERKWKHYSKEDRLVPEQKMVLATTKTIGGLSFTREALEMGVASINGPEALRLILDHDHYYVPVGKIREAQLIDLEEESALVALTDDTHSAATKTHKPTGKRIVEITFPNDNRPFAQREEQLFQCEFTVAVDDANFDNTRAFTTFLNSVEGQEDGAEATAAIGRKSLTPEPLIQFALSYPELSAVLAWLLWRGEKFLRYTIDATARETGEVLAQVIGAKVRKWLGIYDRTRSPDERPITIHIILNTDPQIHLLSRGQASEVNTEIDVGALCQQLELHKDLLKGANSVTFGRSTNAEGWELLYITTNSGTAIAPESGYKATIARLEEIKRTFPICLCLVHKKTGEELHHRTTAVFTPLDEHGKFRFKSNSIPKDFDDWELTQVSLLIDEEAEH